MKSQTTRGRAKGGNRPAHKAGRPPARKSRPASRRQVKATGAVAKPAPAPPRPVPSRPPPTPEQSRELRKQREFYEEGVRLFQARKFERADALFQKASEGPDRTLAHHAQVHSQICRQRLKPKEVSLRTAEENYNYAIVLSNANRLKEAATHLETALQLDPKADHVHYALAAVHALMGNAEAAFQRLKTAIDLQPRNRYLARADSDFAGVREYSPLASLLHPTGPHR